MSFTRRRLLIASALAACAPLRAAAQQTLPRIATVFSGSREVMKVYEEAFLAGMRERGYAAGRNFVFEPRYAGGDVSRYAPLTDEVLALKPTILIGANTPQSLLMKAGAPNLPIVLATSGDPVADGLVQSLARPGGMVTGVSTQLPEIGAKHIELIKEALPSVRRVALLIDPTGSRQQNERYEKLAMAAAAARGMSAQTYSAGAEDAVRQAFRRMQTDRPDALVIFLSPRLNALRRELIEHAMLMRLPTIAHQEHFALEGGLMAYGPNFADGWRRTAYFVDRILKGAKPSDLPIEQPAKFDFVVNLATAKQLGVTFSPALLVRADQVVR